MTYIGVVYKKEGIHWKRMRTMMKQFKGSKKIAGFLVAFVLTIVHYAYAAMHSSYEFFLFLFYRDTFRMNLAKLEATLVTEKK